jgi:hypothetical protein
MPKQQLFLLSLLIIAVLGFVALKVTQKSTMVSAEFDLTTGRSTLKGTPEIHVSESAGNQLLLQLDLSFYKRAQFDIQFQDEALEGSCLNIGDSPTNDGWGGDAGQFSHNAEMQIIGPSGGFLLYGSDEMNKAADASKKAQKSVLIKGEPALVLPKDNLKIEIANDMVGWVNSRTNKPEKIESPYLFALNGQADAKHGGANDNLVFAAFNRVIANPQSRGKCVKAVKITLTRQ